MSLVSISNLGVGGIGLSGQTDTSVFGVLRELRGLNISLVTGGAANAKYNLAAIRSEDTILSVLNNNAGTITDVTAGATIAVTQATGTITCASVAVDDTVTVNGKVYTAKAVPVGYTQFSQAGTDTQDAASLVAAINAREAATSNGVTAANVAGVVTVTAVVDSTAGNALTLLSSNGTRAAVSGAGTLTGGTATGGVLNTAVTNQMVTFWYNKR